MGHKLIHAVLSEEQMSRDEAVKVYRELLEKDTEDPKDVKRFREAVSVLGKASADLTADLNTIQTARALQKRIRDGSGLDKDRSDAQKAVTDYIAETKRLMEERRRGHLELSNAASALEQRWMEAAEADRSLAALKQRHGPVLAHVEPPTLV